MRVCVQYYRGFFFYFYYTCTAFIATIMIIIIIIYVRQCCTRENARRIAKRMIIPFLAVNKNRQLSSGTAAAAAEQTRPVPCPVRPSRTSVRLTNGYCLINGLTLTAE